ncbi:MAG: hypothetical protein IPO50_00435 [Sphingomonadales bacterium]|nr:hypothetical protein [Sphingomonadales bacterium]
MRRFIDGSQIPKNQQSPGASSRQIETDARDPADRAKEPLKDGAIIRPEACFREDFSPKKSFLFDPNLLHPV